MRLNGLVTRALACLAQIWDCTNKWFFGLNTQICALSMHICVEASFMMMNPTILMMPKAQVIDSRLQDHASRIQSKIQHSRFKRRNQEATSQDFKIMHQESNPRFNIQDSREEIKKQQVKTSYRISIKRIFQKTNSIVLFYKRIFSNFPSY